jgi:hypothetical protein
LKNAESDESEDDRFEQNDTFENASLIGEGFYDSLIAQNDDWFKIWIDGGDTLTVVLNFSHSKGDINLYLYNFDKKKLTESDSKSDNEQTQAYTSIPNFIYVHVDLVNESEPNDYYTLYFWIDTLAGDDIYEENDYFDSAHKIWEGSHSGLVAADEDWFYIRLDEGESIEISITNSDNPDDNLIIALYDNEQNLLSENGESETETHYFINLEWTALYDGLHYILITQNTTVPYYNLWIVTRGGSGDDDFEDNDDFNSAYTIIPDHFSQLTALDDDWYRLWVKNDWTIDMGIQHGGNTCELNLFLYNTTGEILVNASSDKNYEIIEYVTKYEGYHYVNIDRSSSPCGDYSMFIHLYKNLDKDQDGLSNWEEQNVYNTDPNHYDTDGDFFSDFDEVTIYDTDPNQPNELSEELIDVIVELIPGFFRKFSYWNNFQYFRLKNEIHATIPVSVFEFLQSQIFVINIDAITGSSNDKQIYGFPIFLFIIITVFSLGVTYWYLNSTRRLVR